MVIGEQIKQIIASFPDGVVFTISDFRFDPGNDSALAKALSRMAASGELCKVSKGKYYKPKETLLGKMKPAGTEIVKDFGSMPKVRGDLLISYPKIVQIL